MRRVTRGWYSVLPATGVVAYLMMPAAPASPLGGWPLTPLGTAVLAIALALLGLATRLHSGVRAPLRWTLFLGLLIAAKIGLTAAAVDTGWLARYHVNDSWSGQPEWSSDFRFADATRIDRELSMAPGELPAHFLNGVDFRSGNHRDISEPLTVEWRGEFSLATAETIVASVTAAGDAEMVIDGAPWMAPSSSATIERQLPSGRHSAVVRYRKPAGVQGAISVVLQTTDGQPLAIVPPGVRQGPAPVLRTLATLLDVAVVVMLGGLASLTLISAWRSADRLPVVVGGSLAAVLGVQGYFAAAPFFNRYAALTEGDDWLGFESRARAILQNGPLMTLGQPLGQGEAYFYHPFYSYVLAGLHAVTGESLFGPVFAHFLFLAATAFIMWTLARRLFGTVPATCGLVALVALFQVDFIRYYTVTLLSENLYVLTVTLAMAAFARWSSTGNTWALAAAGAWSGLSAVTRPAMMMFFVPALLVTAAMAFRQRRGAGPFRAPLVTGAAWLAVVAPFTIRNWIVSNKLVLISDSLGGGFISHNIPTGVDPQPYVDAYGGGIINSASVLWRLVAEHPAGVASLQLQKIGFTLGMTHWFDGYRPHPELVVITLLYGLMLIASKQLRAVELWPIHAFVLSHWASMGLTSPWNYGYRLILPPYVYTSTLAVAAAAALAWPRVQTAGPRS